MGEFDGFKLERAYGIRNDLLNFDWTSGVTIYSISTALHIFRQYINLKLLIKQAIQLLVVVINRHKIIVGYPIVSFERQGE